VLLDLEGVQPLVVVLLALQLHRLGEEKSLAWGQLGLVQLLLSWGDLVCLRGTYRRRLHHRHPSWLNNKDM